MVICCVTNCTSGSNNAKKSSKFSFPRDPELHAKWLEAIPLKSNILTNKLFVCEQHFAESDLIRYWQSGCGVVVYRIPYKIPKLQENAVPSIFFGTKETKEIR